MKLKQCMVFQKFVLATKSKNLGASWPQGFFSKVEPWVSELAAVSLRFRVEVSKSLGRKAEVQVPSFGAF